MLYTYPVPTSQLCTEWYITGIRLCFYNEFIQDMPKLRWFQYQREGLGMESYLYTRTRIAKCDRVLQWGFDETSLDGVATMNQWVRIKEGDDLHIVTLECVGLLVGSTASKVAEHVRIFWQRVSVRMLRPLSRQAERPRVAVAVAAT